MSTIVRADHVIPANLRADVCNEPGLPMSEDIRYDKRFALAPGHVEEVLPGVRRLLCNNPGPFTFKGTVTYIVGRGEVAIIDPGPIDEAHIAALLAAVAGETVTHIFVTHTHRDHSPAAARIKLATGAPTYGEGPHRASRPLAVDEAPRLEGSGDRDFKPDVALTDGQIVGRGDWSLEAVATPGHTANHMAFALTGGQVLFSGDHVMAWSTPVVAPPDGSMRDYMASLDKLSRRSETLYFPGHGGAVRDAPRFVASYIAHRKARETSIVKRLGKGEADIPTLVRAIYIGLDPRLAKAAGLSVLAHLEDLAARGLVATDGTPTIDGRYRLA
jgi:glyoxylase-like metal-dependent hydrolase (beta-lactamase superfamily II)